MTKSNADFEIIPDGTVWLFRPLNDDARKFARERIQIEDWQWLGTGFAVEHRYAIELRQILIDEGFILA